MSKIRRKSHLNHISNSKKFFTRITYLPTRDLTLSLKRDSFAAGKLHDSKKLIFRDVTKPILRKSLLQFQPREIVSNNTGVSSWRLFFRRPADNRHCVSRRIRREILFARGKAGNIKVKFAKWLNSSFISCR